MKLIDVHKQFHTEEACLNYLEKMRWPSGLACLKCGSLKVSKLEPKERRGVKGGKRGKTRRIYQCLERPCLHQFTATAGTIFHDTHLPLQKWFLAIALICEAKKGISANQLKRHLGVNYRTAWHLNHRIREAMKENDGQLFGVVEVDETYVGGKVRRRGDRHKPRKEKQVVMGLIERGGKVRFVKVSDAKAAIMQPVIEKHVSREIQTIISDEHPIYPFALAQSFDGKHKTICHRKTYAIGDTHTNTIENAFSLLKRGLIGTFHKVSIKHLSRYLREFEYRFNRRDEQEELFAGTLKNLLRGAALSYRKLTAEA
jgi:transposase-like protein